MINKKHLPSFRTTLGVLSISISLLLPSSSWAQFKKYRSKTKYDNSATPSSKSETASPSIRSLMESQENKKDIFGRNNKPSTNRRKSAKYVHLNPETAFGPEVVTSFDFPKTSLGDLTKHMQQLTGINLIIDKDLKGSVSIMAPSPITVGDAWKAYLAALNMNGYTLVKTGAFYKIVQTRDIRYTPTKIYTGNYTPDTENYSMRIIPLKNISSTEVTRSFRPFMSRYGRIIDIKQTNTIIVQDSGNNINRLVRLIKFIDVPGHDESLQIIRVKHSSAQEIAQLLDKILKGGTRTKRRRSTRSRKTSDISSINIIAEPRTNSIIAMANAEGAKQLRTLIAKLDVRFSASGSGRINVYYLNYADAKKIAETLSKLVGGGKSSKGSRFSRSSGTSLFNAQVKITADEDNNALVITASPTDYLTVKEVINKLDVPREQIYLEGMIMETNVSKASGFGISILGAYGTGGAQKAGFTGGSSDLLSLLTNNITSLGGLFVGGGTGRKITHTVNGQSIELNSVNALVTAIATDSNTNVLATPQLLALDNTDAIFEVGETVPTPERTNAANGSSSVSIKQQKVALKLKFKPRIIKASRIIKLHIEQQIDDFSERQLPEGLKNEGVATTTRSTTTDVIVRDKDTIAMGGLMRDKEIQRVSKVPLLGDIPVLGWLFKQKRRSVEKVNLLLFLTPTILDSPVKAAKTMKDLLNRRSAHLKNTLGEDDPYITTVKGLYEKSKKQQEGPLFDIEDLKYQRQNLNPGIQNAPEAIEETGYPEEAEKIQATEQIQETEKIQEAEQIQETEKTENVEDIDNIKQENVPAEKTTEQELEFSVKNQQVPAYNQIIQKIRNRASSRDRLEKDN